MFQTTSQEFQLAISSVLKAGKIVREIYNTAFQVSWKAKDDPLTEADLQANHAIVSQIKAIFPEDGILSEEITDNKDRLKKDRVWILDPIDGTREFVEKNPEFSISLGLAFEGKAILGVVFNPITKELITGIVGYGISYDILNEDFELDIDKIILNPIQFKQNIQKPSAYVSRTEFYKNKLFNDNPYWKESFDLKPAGSIAYKLALTAANQADFCISLKPKSEWDICAGVALVIASGGVVFDLLNLEEIPFNAEKPYQKGIIAGNPSIIKNMINTRGDFLKASFLDWA